ncbi:MAG: DUF4249 domain-containing protein [Bacteroidota bacterium]|nr:DUF4249 domain-containing protein [Bacteroidota bacterium]
MRRKKLYAAFFLSLTGTLALLFQCRKPYEPVVLIKGDNYLVVDGAINTANGGITTILLSRTRNLYDTVLTRPEDGATISIQSAAGANFPLTATGNQGAYSSAPLNLSVNTQYKLIINTADGKKYESDLVKPKAAPAIDSVTWNQDEKGVNLFVNTHDPTGATQFYRWQFIETWEYQSQLQTPWGYRNGQVYALDFSDLASICYTTSYSTDVLIANTLSLSEDRVAAQPIGFFRQDDSTLAHRASFLVRQFALTAPEYFYWQTIQKNSQKLGTLFDLQPSQLEGNIHCISNPAEPVVGYLSAGTVQEQRIFIDHLQLRNWINFKGNYACSTRAVDRDPNNFTTISMPDDSYAPWYFISGGPLMVAKKVCLDCRLSGGTNQKPSFW